MEEPFVNNGQSIPVDQGSEPKAHKFRLNMWAAEEQQAVRSVWLAKSACC